MISDREKLTAAVNAIEGLTMMCRALLAELEQYRAIDEEEQALSDNEDLLDKILKGV